MPRRKMGKEFSFWSFFLLLLLFMFAHGNGAREMNEKYAAKLMNHHHEDHHNFLRQPTMDGDNQDDVDVHPTSTHDAGQEIDAPHHHGMHGEHVHADPSSHMHHVDLTVTVFFSINDLKLGKKLAVYFPEIDPSTSPPLLPREEAESLPISTKELPHLLKLFSVSEGSLEAANIEDSIRNCENKPIKGETKLCATSLESMLDFVRSIFGLESNFHVITTTHLTKSKSVFQNYTIQEVPKEIPVPKMVACHSLAYPYAIFYCHSQENGKVFKVSLVGDNGEGIEAVANCHMDTSQWSPDHVAFRVVGIGPGSPVCHFFPAQNLIWLPDHV